MVRLVHDALRTRFAQPAGLASPAVTVADPAVGTGTFLLGVLSRIAQTVDADEGAGAVAGAIEAAIKRLIAFEMQLGPFAVAQLRVFAELVHLIGKAPKAPARMFVTDTLGNPYIEVESLGTWYAPISESRREANKIKREEPITVVIGNPPYKEKAKGRGGWIEKGDAKNLPPLEAWLPPRDWGVGAHSKHLRNLYVYFWRWATWKVFDHDPQHDTGIVCFITVAGFLNGPGFQKMRDYLRRKSDAIWAIDCSPEGHQPDVNTRIFQDVQQPVCIVLVSRSPNCDPDCPAAVHYHALPAGQRDQKFAALAALTLDGAEWTDCPTDWRAPFLPALAGAWATYPALEDLFGYNGSGVMPGRTWVIAPDAESLTKRWDKLIHANPERKEDLFVPHLRGGKPGDKHTKKIVEKPLFGYQERTKPIVDERGECNPPLHYGFRSFDRQWIIPDSRVINQPNPELWRAHSDRQVYITAPSDRSPSDGAVDHAMLRGWLQTVFGWKLHVGTDAKPTSLRNFPVQANGAEMLRLACCLATERGIEVCCPVHDALLVEGAAADIGDVVQATQAAMQEASEIVLDGFALRTDAKIVRPGERYMDGRGVKMWNTIQRLLMESEATETAETIPF